MPTSSADLEASGSGPARPLRANCSRAGPPVAAACCAVSRVNADGAGERESSGAARARTGEAPRREQQVEGAGRRPGLNLQRAHGRAEDRERAARDGVDGHEAAGGGDGEGEAGLLKLWVAAGREGEAEADRDQRRVGSGAVALAEADVDCAQPHVRGCHAAERRRSRHGTRAGLGWARAGRRRKAAHRRPR